MITSTNGMTFDEKAHTAVYKGHVVVANAQFNLTCDKLTAYLKKSGNEAGGAPGKSGGKTKGSAAEPAGGNAAKADDSSSGLDHAVAEGNVVIIQDKKGDNGAITRSTGKGAKALYQASTGDITLTGSPEMQQGENRQVAASPDTVMILNRDGHLATKGPSRTVIKNEEDLKKSSKADDAAAAPKPGGAQ